MAASFKFTAKVVSAPATSVTIGGADPSGGFSLTGPVAAGTVLGPISVQPPEWNGDLDLSGPDAAKFAITPDVHGAPQVTTAVSLADGVTTNAQVDATP